MRVDAGCLPLATWCVSAHNSSKDCGATAAAAGGQFIVDFGAHTLLLLLRQGMTVPIRDGHAGLGCGLKLPTKMALLGFVDFPLPHARRVW